MSKKKNILFYSHFYYPETGAATVRGKYFVESLRKVGYEVLVVTPKPNYPLGKIFDGFSDKLIVKNKKENIIYLPILFVGSHSPFGRLLSYFSYSFVSLSYLLFYSYKADIVVSSSPPIFTSLAALLYSKIKGAKFVFDIRDIWPDIGIELGILKNPVFIWGLKKIERFILKNSEGISVTARGDKENIVNKLRDSRKVEVVYNGADVNTFKPISDTEKKEIRTKFNIPVNKVVLVYFGSFNYGMNDIEILGEFLSHKKVIEKDIHFLSIGSGDNLESLMKKIKGKITFTKIESLPSLEVAKLVAASDISVIPRKGIIKDTGGNIPVKCFESWAAGIPVLLSNIKDAEISDIFNKCEAGILVKPNDVDDLINGLEELLEDDLSALGIKGREFVIKNFDRAKQTEKFVELINNCA